MLGKRWIKQDGPLHLKDMLCSDLGISPTTSNILISRGITGTIEADLFIRASLDDLIEPFTLPDMARVVARVKRAFNDDEKILIYGDYDADGITATALLCQFFRMVGKKASCYIPERQEEGYGVSITALEKIKAMGVGLVITVDCGISAVAEVEAASQMGMDVIITDHHEPPAEIPAAYAILNPCLKGSAYPFTGLAGVGVALKLAQGVLAGLDGKDKAGPGLDPRLVEFLDLVALGTIADVVPLKGENRILVKHGLRLLNEGGRPGVKKLKEVAMVNGGRVTSGTVGFQLAPRLNASGRIGRAEAGVRLLTTTDLDEAGKIAAELDQMNRDRQKIESVILEDARSMIQVDHELELGAIVLSSEDWHQGVIGIVASKLVEEFYRPTVLISMKKTHGKGSARSIPAFHLYEGLERLSGLLEGYGGHKYAAGLTVSRENLGAFKREFDALVRNTLSPDDFLPSLKIDGEVGLGDLDWGLYEEISRLAPFGSGNAEPVLQAGRLDVLYPKVVGKNHVRMKVKQGGRVMGSIGFNMGGVYQRLAMGKVSVDAAFCLDMTEWQGDRQLQLNIKDLHF